MRTESEQINEMRNIRDMKAEFIERKKIDYEAYH
jgi:hypothetical protein